MQQNVSIQKYRDFFEKHYHNVRVREQRIYSNQQIAKLPEIEPGHPHANEWICRKRSSERLIELLKKKKTTLNILEVGCGNGWLSSRLSTIQNSKITGMDINRIELMQAVTVFEKKDNLHFIYGDIRSTSLKRHAFDIIVFAASIQYFSSFTDIINTALSLLASTGEIHIIDTSFYKKGEKENAFQRTKHYYSSIGFEEMSDFYFHHCIDDIKAYNHKIVYNPNNIVNKWKKNHQPFYYIIIKQN